MTAMSSNEIHFDTTAKMNGGIRIVRNSVFALMIWVVFFLALFTWYGAWLLPERAVSIRILASVLSDIVWMPLGVILWFKLFDWIFFISLIRGGSLNKIVWRSVIFIVTVCFVGFAHNLLFRFLFVPAVFLAVRSLVSIRLSTLRISLFIPSLPLWLFVLLTCFYYGWQLVPMSSPAVASESDISLMSYNIYKRGDSDQRNKIISTIKREMPDVVCLVEVNTRKDEPLLRNELSDIYPYIVTNEQVHYIRTSAMVLSKYPVSFMPINIRSLGLGQIDFTFMDVEVGDITVHLVNFHLITVGHHFERMHHDTGDIRERLAESSVNEAELDETRFAQVQRIGQLLETFEGPIILCGDLNDTSNSRMYRYFNKRYNDPYAQCGWGLGSTFGREWLLRKPRIRSIPLSRLFARDVIRIDHIFVGGGILPVSMKVLSNADGSDHRPILASVKLQ